MRGKGIGTGSLADDRRTLGCEGSRPTRAGQMIEKRTLWAMAVGSGLAVANIYYVQPLLADMGSYFGVPDRRMGLISMLSQVGFATGMLLFLPLGDRLERRSFILGMLGAATVALLGVAAAPNFVWLAAASLAVGVTSITPQLLVPFAAHLAEPAERGQVVGTVMSGLLIGILAARTVSGVVGEHPRVASDVRDRRCRHGSSRRVIERTSAKVAARGLGRIVLRAPSIDRRAVAGRAGVASIMPPRVDELRGFQRLLDDAGIPPGQPALRLRQRGRRAVWTGGHRRSVGSTLGGSVCRPPQPPVDDRCGLGLHPLVLCGPLRIWRDGVRHGGGCHPAGPWSPVSPYFQPVPDLCHPSRSPQPHEHGIHGCLLRRRGAGLLLLGHGAGALRVGAGSAWWAWA